MPTIMRSPSHSHHMNDVSETKKPIIKRKNFAQTTTMGLGFFLILLSLCGLLLPSFAGLHLSAMHATSLGFCGVLAVWAGGQDNFRKNFVVDISLGLFFFFHALAGFLLGAPGKPGVGFEAMDPLLVKIMPGFNELGRNDHILHTILAVTFFLSALFFWRHYRHLLKRA